MSEQVANQDVAANKDASKLKRAGQTCITFFVVFVICLLAFGKRPAAVVSGPDGWSSNLNLISCLGVVMGFFALIFLLTGFRRILRVGGAKKVLGLIGCFGLVAHSLLAILMPLSWGATTTAAVGTSGNLPIAQSGPEKWTVDGKTYDVASTYFLNLREGFQYTIEYPHHFSDSDRGMNDERALAIVFPLMKHAYAQGLYKRSTVAKVGQGEMTPSRIGITLFEKEGSGAKGYRVGLSLDQIKRRMDAEATSAPAAKPN